MPTPTKGPRLGGSPAHERLMLANLATSLFRHGKITTTETKAKRLRPLAEQLITKAKRGDLHARRRVLTVVRDKDVVYPLFDQIAPRYANRDGRVHPDRQDRTRARVTPLRWRSSSWSRSWSSRRRPRPPRSRPPARPTKAEAVAALAGDEEAASLRGRHRAAAASDARRRGRAGGRRATGLGRLGGRRRARGQLVLTDSSTGPGAPERDAGSAHVRLPARRRVRRYRLLRVGRAARPAYGRRGTLGAELARVFGAVARVDRRRPYRRRSARDRSGVPRRRAGRGVGRPAAAP